VQKEDKQEINLSQVIYGNKKGRKVKEGAENDEERSHNCVCTEPRCMIRPSLLYLISPSFYIHYSSFIIFLLSEFALF